MKVKEFNDWDKIVFAEIAILKDDLKYMSSEQKNFIDEFEVIRSESCKKIVFAERTMFKDDLNYTSSEQKNYINELEVIRSDNKGKILYIEER